jgi:RNA polymerase II subunit A small phosphatase-like protein
MATRQRILLILDVDETLIHARGEPLRGRQHDFNVGTYHVYRRPHLEAFLTTCAKTYDLAIWSSGGSDYVEGIVASIMPPNIEPVFVWSRERCTARIDTETRDEVFLKDLRKVKRKGFGLDRVLIVEDTPTNVQRHYGNAIYVSSFTGDAADDELALLEQYLVSIHTVQNVRALEKRGWRHQPGRSR